MAKHKSNRATRDRSGALYVLLDPEQLRAMDAIIDELNKDNIGPQWNRMEQNLVRKIPYHA